MRELVESELASEIVPISLVAHTVFCPRRAWLEVAGEKTDTAQMQSGTTAHRRVDDPDVATRAARRAVPVKDDELGFIGRCDVIEIADDDSLRVTEYKSTPVRRRAEVTEAMRVQIALQTIGLEAGGFQVTGADVYFTEHKTRVPVEIDEDLRVEAGRWVQRTREVVTAATAPPPLVDDPRCARCSHAGVCLPDERDIAPVRRRILVADPDGQIVHLSTPGSRASSRRGRMVVSKTGEELASVPLERIQGMVVHGNVDLSSALIRELSWRDLTIVWCSSVGRIYAWSRTADAPNGSARVAQHVASLNGHLEMAREIVASKIANQATWLRRSTGATTTVARMRELQREAARAPHIEALYGVEGEAAALYFGDFCETLNAERGVFFTSRWEGRIGRGATDPLNAALNYCYALLTAECIRAAAACGLDPNAGFLHSPSRNKPALALDLMEMFRSPVADSAVVRAINNGELDEGGFSAVLGAYRLTPDGRKKIIRAFEQRIMTEFTHPVFGYTLTWRRAIEVQARMVLGVLDGSQENFVGVRTR